MIIKKGLICGLIVTLLCLHFSGCMGDSGLSIEKLDYEPEDYINITTEQMDDYPKIKEAVTIINSDNYNKTHTSISCNQKEEEKIHALFGGYYGLNFFKYNEDYYSLRYYSAD